MVLARSVRLSAVWPDPVGMVTEAPAVVVRVKDEEGRVEVGLAAASEYHAPVLARLLTTIVWVPATVPVAAVAETMFALEESRTSRPEDREGIQCLQIVLDCLGCGLDSGQSRGLASEGGLVGLPAAFRRTVRVNGSRDRGGDVNARRGRTGGCGQIELILIVGVVVLRRGRHRGGPGVPVRVFSATKKTDGKAVWFDWAKTERRVGCSVLRDHEFGPGFIRICTYFPWPAKVWLNGHEWAKRQAGRARVPFTELANGKHSQTRYSRKPEEEKIGR